jgi:hypothetical protein
MGEDDSKAVPADSKRRANHRDKPTAQYATALIYQGCSVQTACNPAQLSARHPHLLLLLLLLVAAA